MNFKIRVKRLSSQAWLFDKNISYYVDHYNGVTIFGTFWKQRQLTEHVEYPKLKQQPTTDEVDCNALKDTFILGLLAPGWTLQSVGQSAAVINARVLPTTKIVFSNVSCA